MVHEVRLDKETASESSRHFVVIFPIRMWQHPSGPYPPGVSARVVHLRAKEVATPEEVLAIAKDVAGVKLGPTDIDAPNAGLGSASGRDVSSEERVRSRLKAAALRAEHVEQCIIDQDGELTIVGQSELLSLLGMLRRDRNDLSSGGI